MAANERFFWPFGLALTWDNDPETGIATNLHVRQWDWGDGHREAIELEPNDEIGERRHQAFDEWVTQRLAIMPIEGERRRAWRVVREIPV